MPKRIVWAMLTKRGKEKENIHAKRHERKKMHAKEHEEKEKEKEIKIAHTFKAFIQKQRDS